MDRATLSGTIVKERTLEGEMGQSVLQISKEAVFDEATLIINSEGAVTLKGFKEAKVGSVAQKGEDNTLIWKDVDLSAIEDVKADIEILNSELTKKSDKSDVYTKIEMDEKLDIKADKSTTLEGYGITDGCTQKEAFSMFSQNENDIMNLTHRVDNIEIIDIPSKADKATTLEGYGITDAYTKAAVNTKFNELQSIINYQSAGISESIARASQALEKTDELQENKADKAEIPTKVSELENDTNYVTNTDYATSEVGGVVKVSNYSDGLFIKDNGALGVYGAEKSVIKAKKSWTAPITPVNLDYAVEVCTNQTMSDDNTEAQGQLPASYNAVKTYVDTQKPQIVIWDEPTLLFRFSQLNNTVNRACELTTLSITFDDGIYDPLCTMELSFDSGETPTSIDYTDSGILNWVGTDCAMDSYVNDEGITVPISKFQPSPNTHYDIVFYFNGTQFIGLVNGFVSTTQFSTEQTEGNEAVE